MHPSLIKGSVDKEPLKNRSGRAPVPVYHSVITSTWTKMHKSLYRDNFDAYLIKKNISKGTSTLAYE